MANSTVADFRPLMKGRMERRLQYLTNNDATQGGSLPTIDDDVLDYALADAIGQFRLQAGRMPSHTDMTDVSIMVKWTIVCLGVYHALSGVNVDQERHYARLESKDLRERMTPGPTTNDNTSRSDPTHGGTTTVRPDSDRAHFTNYLPRTGGGRRLPGGRNW